MKYADLKPRIADLSQLISQQLDVNDSQVALSGMNFLLLYGSLLLQFWCDIAAIHLLISNLHSVSWSLSFILLLCLLSEWFQVKLLNFTARGNDSLIRWAILPAGSAEYFTNATAMVSLHFRNVRFSSWITMTFSLGKSITKNFEQKMRVNSLYFSF